MNTAKLLPLFAFTAITAAATFPAATFADTTAKTEEKTTTSQCPATLNHTLRQLDSEQTINLCEQYQDKMVLIVNTASHCGFTPQFTGLEKIYQEYKERGFVVLGMPSNDFAQDPGSEEDTAKVCNGDYKVTFPMFEKMHVTRLTASPLYKTLGELAGGEYPAWNFHKYLVYKGELVASFPSRVTPEDKQIVSMIEDFLPKQ